jgi:ketosteroid isomerase-like protein
MTSPNVDLVRSIYTAWERGDFGAAEWAHPEIELVIGDGLRTSSWIGVAVVTEAARDFRSTWEDWREEVDEYRELDSERVLVLTRRSGHGKTSGLEIGELQTRGAMLFHVRDGKVTRQVFYWDRDRAFADLGLAPESGSR